MPDRWVESPREKQPYRCIFTQQDSPADGPYFEARLTYFPAVDDGGRLHPGRHPHQLFISPQSIREMCQLPGSPLVAVTRQQFDEILDERNRYEENAADLAAEVEMLKDEIENLRKYAASPVDVGSLADALAARIKPTPRAKSKA